MKFDIVMLPMMYGSILAGVVVFVALPSIGVVLSVDAIIVLTLALTFVFSMPIIWLALRRLNK